MQRLEVSCVVKRMYTSLGAKGLSTKTEKKMYGGIRARIHLFLWEINDCF